MRTPSHLTKAQAARACKCAASTITKLVDNGVLPIESWFGTEMIPASALPSVHLKKPGRRPHTSKEPS